MIISVVCLSNFSAALYGYDRSSQSADELADRQISEKAKSLAALVNEGVHIPKALFGQDTIFQVWQGSQLTYQSKGSPNTFFTPHTPHSSGFHFVSYDGQRWRALVSNLVLLSDIGARDDSFVIVAERFDTYSALTEEILLRAILPIIWILPVLAILVWLIVGVGLHPLERLASILDSRKSDDFDQLAISDQPQELKTIASSMNHLFVRLASVFDREKRFSADAAHELRTPLSALKVNMHNMQRSLGGDENLQDLENSVDRMGQTIEQLLALHRVSLGSNESNRDICDLGEIIQTVVAENYSQIASKNQDVELDAEPATLLADKFALSLMTRNLIDNANKYSPTKGKIYISVKMQKDQIVVRVEDSGPGIPESEYERVIDRFYRVGGDRNKSDVVGSGLGLSIVSQIVAMHNAKMTLLKSDRLKGLAVEVVFS